MKSRHVIWNILSVLLACSMLLACTTKEKVVEKTVVVQQTVVAPQTVVAQQTVVVEKTVVAQQTVVAPQTVVVEVTAIPPTIAPVANVKPPVQYPEPNQLGLGGAEIKRLPIDQIVTYKTLPQYHQAPWLDQFVASGELPPVEKRLPKEPQVYLTSGMKDGVGVYGDLWRAFSACPTAGYNDLAGTTMG